MSRRCASIIGRVIWPALCGVSLAITATTVAQPVPLPPLSPAAIAAGARITHDAGFEFVTIGNQGGAGNPIVPDEYQSFPTPTPGFGRVDYEYRMSRTEVTCGQYFEFVRGYALYFNGTDTVEFLGLGIRVIGDRHNPDNYFIRPGWQNAPAEMGWRFAARFCNWLQNDRATTQQAFQTGAYDATSFTPDPPAGGLNDNTTRLPGAKFFLPTQNEWTKSMYYDPNRFGAGLEGYWQYPTTSELVPVIGAPGAPGTQTSTNVGFLPQPPFPIASYPTVMSPWGLLDGSGGAREWLEGNPALDTFSRAFRGTSQLGDSVFNDQIGFGASGLRGVNSIIGLRLAATVPAPFNIAGVILGGLVLSGRNR